MGDITRVLVVDDSAFVRKLMRQMLSRSPFIEVVGTAQDGAEALEMVEQLRPDVVTLDLTMPGADGLTFLQTQMSLRPVPVIVVSMIAKSDAQVLKALELGAIDVIQKPTGLASNQVLEIGEELVAKVKACASVQLSPITAHPRPNFASPPPRRLNHNFDVIVFGVSTGGPQALKYLVPLLPADLPVPLLIVMHMPLGYTEMFAASLNEVSSLSIAEAREGERIEAGRGYLAPAGHHLTLVRQNLATVNAHLDLRPFDTLHRPSVDVLFRSAADVYGGRTLGVVMTGMGSDGTEGAAWIKAKGGRIFAEAEESCVVYGMPRSIIDAGLCDRSVPLGRMSEAILEAL